MITKEQKRLALEAIAAKHSGTITPDAVVDAARDPKNILHECFNWDRDNAALEHWRDVARTLIREVRIRVVIEERAAVAVAYVRNPALPAEETGYIALSQVERKSADAEAIIRAELDRIISAVNRARGIADLLGLRDDFDDLLESSVSIKKKMDAPPRASRSASGRSDRSARV